jgi:2-dehydropantoate 2-reductase
MRVTVIGCGAIGGWLAAGFAAGGAEVAVLARGATLAALQARGLVLRDGAAERVVPVRASGDPTALPPADLLVLGLKGQDLPGALAAIRALLAPGTVLLSAQNGVPWFFLQGFGGKLAGAALESVDPGGAWPRRCRPPARWPPWCMPPPAWRRRASSGWRRPTGCRWAMSAAATAPCWTRRWPCCAPAASRPRRPGRSANMNPLSALCHATLSDMLDEPGVRGLAEAMMAEMDALGQRIGLAPLGSIEARMAVTRRIGAFRTSMLQDLEAGRRLELGPILGALVEMAERLGHPAPVMRGVHGLVRLLERSRG